ncbi:hypothetical protein [Kribbella sp. CA-293567]|uniref:hypothetical protein n=1 Tax=Kribbella sp. CA-293567 TaxID=3002436 RepID=UPI0022DDD888|nr:hypothetical protein [Kribbella sp. CA-293567]WBQ08432.1 hypothetical protein OX958_16830 [Kribbella sp. CA-293567]
MAAGPGDLDAQTEGFAYFSTQMGGVVADFDDKLRTSADSSAVAPSDGLMQEGDEFMLAERGARDQLGQVMANASRGLKGYQGAVGEIGVQYDEVIVRNSATMRALLRTDTSPAAVDPAYARPGVLPPTEGGI